MKMKSYVDRPISEVYDPTCGDGALLSVFAPEVKKYGQELNADQLEVAASRLENFEGACGDTLQAPAFEGKKFECIMANPPFSIKWEHPRSGVFSLRLFITPPTAGRKTVRDGIISKKME